MVSKVVDFKVGGVKGLFQCDLFANLDFFVECWPWEGAAFLFSIGPPCER